jgi:hypothetical protein
VQKVDQLYGGEALRKGKDRKFGVQFGAPIPALLYPCHAFISQLWKGWSATDLAIIAMSANSRKTHWRLEKTLGK